MKTKSLYFFIAYLQWCELRKNKLYIHTLKNEVTKLHEKKNLGVMAITSTEV